MYKKDDELNAEILERRTRLREEISGPRIGDYVLFPDAAPPNDRQRIAHDWGNDPATEEHLGVQPSPSGSFYLDDGYASGSGAMNPIFGLAHLIDTGQTRPGLFWFFSRDYAGAGRGVHVEVPCRVYRYEGPPVRHY